METEFVNIYVLDASGEDKEKLSWLARFAEAVRETEGCGLNAPYSLLTKVGAAVHKGGGNLVGLSGVSVAYEFLADALVILDGDHEIFWYHQLGFISRMGLHMPVVGVVGRPSTIPGLGDSFDQRRFFVCRLGSDINSFLECLLGAARGRTK